MGQKITEINFRNSTKKPKGVWISKKSIGTVWVDGVPYTFNANLVKDNKIDFSTPQSSKKKTIIIIKKK